MLPNWVSFFIHFNRNLLSAMTDIYWPFHLIICFQFSWCWMMNKCTLLTTVQSVDSMIDQETIQHQNVWCGLSSPWRGCWRRSWWCCTWRWAGGPGRACARDSAFGTACRSCRSSRQPWRRGPPARCWGTSGGGERWMGVGGVKKKRRWNNFPGDALQMQVLGVRDWPERRPGPRPGGSRRSSGGRRRCGSRPWRPAEPSTEPSHPPASCCWPCWASPRPAGPPEEKRGRKLSVLTANIVVKYFLPVAGAPLTQGRSLKVQWVKIGPIYDLSF